jgi:ribosomal protein L3
MKRHNWKGQPASHGQSLTHRVMGSAGGSQGSGSRVIPGKKMPGRMGAENVTVKNLRVLQVDETNGLVVVNGTSDCFPHRIPMMSHGLTMRRLRTRSQEPDYKDTGRAG